MKILLTGTNGQLGHDLRIALDGQADIIAATRDQMNLEDLNQVRSVVRAIKPDLIISPAAYTAVVKAETDIDRATRINAEASEVLAQEAASLQAGLISYSTDYVFDGQSATPYTEDNPVNPLNVYGKTKLAGEEAIRHYCPDHWILRTSWVYSVHGGNFLKTAIRLAQDKEAFTIVGDQFGAPTWSRTIAQVTRQMLSGADGSLSMARLRETAGTYHLSALGETSWHQYASFVASELVRAGIPVKVRGTEAITPVGSDTYPTPPVRPKNSRLSCQKLQSAFQLTLPQWQDDVSACLQEIIQAYDLASGKPLPPA